MVDLIRASNVSMSRQGKRILDDVSLTIETADFVTLVGPNGAGKTMLLNALLGLVAVDSGEIERTADLRVGYIPQRISPSATLPIKVQRFLALTHRADNATITQIADEARISHLLNRPLHVLSGGEMQRVMLARALMNQPHLMVLDEPAQNLDLSGQLAFYETLQRIYQQRGISIFMVSHDLHLVMASSKRVICLYHHVCCSGTPKQVAQDPEFNAMFGGDLAKMMAVYQHDHDHGHDHAHEGHICDNHG